MFGRDFDLNTVEVFAVVGEKVVALVVAAGLGEVDSVVGGVAAVGEFAQPTRFLCGERRGHFVAVLGKLFSVGLAGVGPSGGRASAGVGL